MKEYFHFHQSETIQWGTRMKKKINTKVMLIAAIAIVVTAVCSMLLFYQILESQIFDDLKANAHVISQMGVERLTEKSDYDLGDDGLRITLIGEDGIVIYDSLENEAVMENHNDRPEIIEAYKSGEGTAIRKSATSADHTF